MRAAQHVQPEPFREEAQTWVFESAEDEKGTGDVAEEEVEEEEYVESLGDGSDYMVGFCMIISRLLLLGLRDNK